MIVSNHITQLLANARVADLHREAVASRRPHRDLVAGRGPSESGWAPARRMRGILRRRTVVPTAVSEER